ncbi:SDR family oxidoreductase [Streptantibioticus parmotrematis]|uniref:SDR family oxidoreductase n=1 Tax=Streptantibioticus parmotrematis TaxID=2873249 RepID=UPI00207C0352|nr:sugar nucleotide-binding protein [Streptantibioticus parmotrematis]
MTILIVGGSGFLGSELVRQATTAGQPTVTTYATAPGAASPTAWCHLDLRDATSLDATMAEVNPSVVINASSGRADWAITAEGPLQLAIVAAKHGIRMVHVSTDAVFSGIGRVHYDESCLPDPITPYGAAKAAAETGVLAVHPKAVVARTSLIIGHGRSVHERLVHQLAEGTVDGALFTDDIRCPVHVSDLAAALLELALSDAAGIHHVAGTDALSRHELGVLIAKRASQRLPSTHGPASRQRCPRRARRTPRQPDDSAVLAHPTARRPRISTPPRGRTRRRLRLTLATAAAQEQFRTRGERRFRSG